MKTFLLCALWLLLCLSAEAKRKHSSSSVTLLKPSRASLLMQNQMINQMGLVRIGDEQELSKLVEQGKLSALPINETLHVSPSLPANRRYVLPMVNSFLVKLASEYYAEFHQPLVVDSAVRPVTVQKWLHRHNASAAPIHGETASSHEAGTTVDLSRHMTKRQESWLDWRFAYYILARNLIIVEKEKHCYHVMVIRELR